MVNTFCFLQKLFFITYQLEFNCLCATTTPPLVIAMSVLLETSVGEIVIDLFVDDCPLTCKNFLKLCKIKYYNNCLFYNVQQNFIAQTGDPTGTGNGGMSAYGLMYGEQAKYFEDEIRKHLKHNKVGIVSMAHGEGVGNTSQFFITLRGEDMSHLDGKHTIFGEVAEGLDVLEKLNNLYCDEEGRPFQDVRIRHTCILDDPYPDPVQLEIPPASPDHTIPPEETVLQRLPYEDGLAAVVDAATEAELEESIRRKEAESRAIVLEMTGDIPDAEAKPPNEVLFVCKLNPVTTDEDLELIFSRFGSIRECAIVRDYKTGDSLNYAFIEFETEDACLEAYEKMNNVLIDDRRIKVDFSQSVAKLWNKYLLQPKKDKSKGSVTAPLPRATAPRKTELPRKGQHHDQKNDIRRGQRRSKSPSRHRREQPRESRKRSRSRSRNRRMSPERRNSRRDRSRSPEKRRTDVFGRDRR